MPLFPALLQQFGDEAGPTGLVAGAKADAAITVKVFIEQDVISKMFIRLEFLQPTEYRPMALSIFQKNVRHSPGQFLGYFPQVHHVA